jgi:uncharacterized protein YcbX
MRESTEVGHVKEIWRYPVKSMAGERLEEVHVSWNGMNGDRRASFVRGDNQSGFPWLTAREIPQINQYRPRYADLAAIKNAEMLVETPHGRSLPLSAPELKAELAQLYGHDVSLIRIKRGVFDDLPLSIMSMASVQALAEAADIAPDVRRWRQNVIIETVDGRAFVEESWLGQTLSIGDIRLRLNKPISRCVMVNVDPETAVKDKHVLKMVANTRDNYVGVGCIAETIGTIRVGDVIRLGQA